MSVQSPPVTVITLPTDLVAPTTSAPSTTTTVTTTPSTTTPSIELTATTAFAPSPPTTITVEAEPAEGLVILVFLGVGAVVGLAMIVWKVVRRWSSTRAAARMKAPVGGAGLLTERVRQIAARASLEEAEPGSAGIDAVALADLYPWAGNSEELTLVVDLTTVEALDIDSNTMTTAAQTVLSRRSGPDHR